ncbi:LysR family transcriptional regulator [Paenibacillus sp. CAU 1782]
MTLLQLAVFIAIHEKGSFTKAAESLNMSQSAVSHSLQSLEAELGIELFDRNKREVRITEAGTSFLPHAREALNQTRIIEEKALSLTKLESGKVKIGCFPSFTANLIPKLLLGFHQKHPNIECIVTEGDYCDIAEWVKEGEVDIGFSVDPNNELTFNDLFDDPIHVVMSDTHRLNLQTTINIGSIAAEPYINVRGYEQLLNSILQNSSSRLNINYNLSNTFSIISIVRAGLGITLLPELAIPFDSKGISTRQLTPSFNRSIGLVTRSVSTPAPAVQAFMRYSLQMLKKPT